MPSEREFRKLQLELAALQRQVRTIDRATQRIPARFASGGGGGSPGEWLEITGALGRGGLYTALICTAADGPLATSGSAVLTNTELRTTTGGDAVVVVNYFERGATTHLLTGIETPVWGWQWM